MTPEEFARAFRRMRDEADARLRAAHHRSLPTGDLLNDRWQRARRLGFAEGASIYDSALVFGDVRVGEGTWIGPFTLLDGSGGGLEIGAWCSISTGVHLYNHDTVMWALSAGRVPRRTAGLTIGDCCHLGAQAIVAAGVTVGRQSVVAANSFVNRDVPERSIVAGTPARPIGRGVVDGDEIRLEYDGKQG